MRMIAYNRWKSTSPSACTDDWSFTVLKHVMKCVERRNGLPLIGWSSIWSIVLMMMTPPMKISVFRILHRIMLSVDNISDGNWPISSRNRIFNISNMLTFSGKCFSLAISSLAIWYGLIPYLSKGKQNIWSICLLPKIMSVLT